MPNIRPATPADEIKTISNLIWSEHPALMAYEFADRDDHYAFMQVEWPATGSYNSYDVAHLAIENDKIIGLLTAFPQSEIEPRYDFMDALHRPALSPDEAAELDAKLVHLHQLFPMPAAGSFYILDISVAPSQQGNGIGKALLNHAKSCARAAGCTSLCLDLYAENPALAFYQSQGLSILSENHVPALKNHNIGRHYHMSMPL